MLFREPSPQHSDTFSYTAAGLRPWTRYEFSVRAHNPAGFAHSPWLAVTTRQAPPRGLAPPAVSHVRGRPGDLSVSWTPPAEPNGVLQSYRIQRNNVSFSFSFDPTVVSYSDEDLRPFSEYRYRTPHAVVCLGVKHARPTSQPGPVLLPSYRVLACTSEGCIASPETNITTLEAPPDAVDAPTVDAIASDGLNVSWSAPLTENGALTEYVLTLDGREVYSGRGLQTALSELDPHTSYQLLLLACTSGGCTSSASVSAVTQEAPPAHLSAPTLKVFVFTWSYDVLFIHSHTHSFLFYGNISKQITDNTQSHTSKRLRALHFHEVVKYHK